MIVGFSGDLKRQQSWLSTCFIQLLLIIFCSTSLFIVNVKSQPLLPPDEANSIIWLTKQFHLGFPTTNASNVCGALGVKCQLYENGTVLHVTEIIRQGIAMNQGAPDPAFTQLYFPMITKLSVSCLASTGVENNSTVLSVFNGGMPLLLDLTVTNCNNIDQIPQGFPLGLPVLNILTLTNLNIQSIPNSIFQLLSLKTLFITGNYNLKSIDIPENEPNNGIINLYTQIPVSDDLQTSSLYLKASHFKKLNYLILFGLNYSLVNLRIETPTSALQINCPSSIMGTINLPGVESIETWTGQFNDTNVYINGTNFPQLKKFSTGILKYNGSSELLSFYITAPQITIVNMQNTAGKIMSLPQSLVNFSFVAQSYVGNFLNDNNLLLSLPNLTDVKFDYMTQQPTLSPSIKNFEWGYINSVTKLPTNSDYLLPNVEYSSIKMPYASPTVTGALPTDYKFKDGGSLDILGSSGVTGIVPDNYCNLAYLNINGTGITDVSTCFKCNWAYKPVTFILPASITSTIPNTYFCPTRLDTTSFIFTSRPLVNRTGSFHLKGFSLGYGIPNQSALQLIHPMTEYIYTISNIEMIPRKTSVMFGNLKSYNGLTANSIIYNITWSLFYIKNLIIIPAGNIMNFELYGFFELGQPQVSILSPNDCSVVSFNSTYIRCNFSNDPVASTLPARLNISLIMVGTTNETFYETDTPNIYNPVVIKAVDLVQYNASTLIYIVYNSTLYDPAIDPFTYEIQIDGVDGGCIASRTTLFLTCRWPTTLKDQQHYSITVLKTNNPPWNSVSAPFDRVFKQIFPYVTSVSPDLYTNQSRITMYGNFGLISPNSSIITIQSINCPLFAAAPTILVCDYPLDPPITPGVKTLTINTIGWVFKKNDLIIFKNPPTDPDNNGTTGNSDSSSEECQCGMHGYCIVLNGLRQCQCTDGYTGEQCQNSPYTGGNMTVNTTTPSVSFNTSDGEDFSFNLISIQELDMDGYVVMEMNRFNWSFMENTTMEDNQSDRQLTIITYNNNNTAVALDPLNNYGTYFNGTNVQIILQHANFDREVEFAGVNNSLNANSIKLAMNISSWPYRSTLNSLRAVFASDIGEGEDCDGNKIDPFITSQFDPQSVEYLQIVKGNIIFYGRFIDRILSNRRVSYSRSEVLNVTKSSIVIGLNLPYCNECIIDPDFSLVISVDGKASSQCSESSSNTWKIIVGCVVGGVVAMALIGGTVKYIHHRKVQTKQDKDMKAKLKRLSSTQT